MRRRTFRITLILLILLSFLSANSQVITFDHLHGFISINQQKLSPQSRSVKIQMNRGDKLLIKIVNTYPACFVYKTLNIEVTDPITSLKPPSNRTKEQLKLENFMKKQEVFTYVFPGGIRIFQISISHKKECEKKFEGADLKKYTDTIYIIITEKRGPWLLSLSGGFTISGLVDRVYIAQEIKEGEKTMYVARRIRKEEDIARLGGAVFLHITHKKWPNVALSFGVGTDSQRLDYFAGLSWLWGDKGALTLGAHVGRIKDLSPAALSGTGFENTDFLTNTREKTAISWFIGFSYTFLKQNTPVIEAIYPTRK